MSRTQKDAAPPRPRVAVLTVAVVELHCPACAAEVPHHDGSLLWPLADAAEADLACPACRVPLTLPKQYRP
jgi:endogenous inhibitor of DNA gyrase (YacG/DUF329 family)